MEEKLDRPAVQVRGIVEAKQCWSVIGWVTKIFYLVLLSASEGTNTCPIHNIANVQSYLSCEV
jgi:hypothetical protein